MSCQLKAYAKIDVEGLRSHLDSVESTGRGDRYDDSSGHSRYNDDFSEASFLNECIMSLSPGGEFLVFAHRKKLSIFSAKWDSHEDDDVKIKFRVTWEGNPCHSQSEEITAVLCLPLIMPSKPSRSSHANEQIDWTCIAVGFSSGYVRFYDEGGNLLISEQIYHEPVMYLKCQSYHPSMKSSYDDYPEEIYVTFRSTIAVIPGFALFQTLRACRNQLARVKANFAEHLTPPPLTLKKWSFVDQDKLKDCEIIGPSSSDMFDHLMTASIRGGFNASYRSGAPKSTLMVAAGKGPFLGFHLAMEGVEGRSVLTDVAQVVKSKFKGFFFSGGSDRQKTAATMEPPEDLVCRFGICDFNREAEHIVRSPNREYSVVTDGLGRVTLVHNLRGIAVRMWKGYRKAQCGWLQVEEEEPSQKGYPKHLLRTAFFLVIYDPKKGILEVWTVPNGIRIAAFSCSKKGRLLYTSHGLVGLNNAAFNWANKSVVPCMFVDPIGITFQIVVPFHCALSDATSERAADLALLRKLKSTLREDDLGEEQLAQEVGLLAAELKTAEVRKQMLSTLISNKHVTVDALEVALAVFMDRASSTDTSSSDSFCQNLLLSSQQLRNLLSFYKFVQQQGGAPPSYTSVVPQEGVSDLQAVCDVLAVSEREVSALKSLMTLINPPVRPHVIKRERDALVVAMMEHPGDPDLHDFHESSPSTPSKGAQREARAAARVTFSESTSTRSSLINYLSCFEFGKKSDNNVAPNAVGMKELPSSKIIFLSELLFQAILYCDVPVEVWQAEAACSGILPFNLLQLAIEFWLHKSSGKALEVEMIRFSEIIKAICLLEEVNSCDLSSFWSWVRAALAKSPQPFNALTAALVCRAVAYSLEKQGLKKHSKSPKKVLPTCQPSKDSEGLPLQRSADTSIPTEQNTVGESLNKAEFRSGLSEWENVSWDSVKWNLLIGRLEDIALLDLVLSQNPYDLCDYDHDETHFPLLYNTFEKCSISLASVLQKGKGVISELVAKWLTTSGLDPKLLIDASDIELSDKNSGFANSPLPMEIDEPGPEDKSEVMVREGIPLTTEKGTEASAVMSPHTELLDKIYLLRKHFPYSLCGSALIANMSWEYLLTWHKNPQGIEILNAALTCLEKIPDIHIQQGVCSLIWSSHIKQSFETVIQFVNKCNGSPKNILCVKELQMSRRQLDLFVETSLKFIELFIEATNVGEVMHRPGPNAVINRCEDVWDYEDDSITVPNTPSLTSLALIQPQASFNHLHSLHQLAIVAQMILSLDLRGQQLTPLFTPLEWSMFFSDHQHLSYSEEPIEPQISNSRTRFLIRVITAATGTSHPNVAELFDTIPKAMQWFGKCTRLAYTWRLSIDPIRRHLVFLLYLYGHDRSAEEILPAVNDVDLLAQQLFTVCGQRFKLILRHLNIEEEIAIMDTFLSHYIEELKADEVFEASVADTALLMAHVMKHLPEDHPERLLAELLSEALEACQGLKSKT